jgi:lysophospholipase
MNDDARPEFAMLTLPDGVRLRHGRWRPPGAPVGTVVLLGGRCEFIEKYQETAGMWLSRGWQVFSLDWRNQGLSDRPLANPQIHHLTDFGVLADDLAVFMARTVEPAAIGPRVLMAHSMGALAATLYLARHANPFAAAVLSAPMYDIPTAPWPRPAAVFIARTACTAGWGACYAPGQGDYDPDEGIFRPDNPITSDARRYAAFHEPFRQRPELRVGGVSYAWVRAALAASDAVRWAESLERVRLPALLLSAPDDTIIDAASHPVVARRLAACALLTYAGARHELLMECDAIRERVWSDVDAFLENIR